MLSICFALALMLSAVGMAMGGYEEIMDEEPYVFIPVSDWYDLDDMRNNLGATYVLMNHLTSDTPGYDDLVGTAEGWEPIGWFNLTEDTEFKGTFDGNGYFIRDLYINRSGEDDVGLFGCLGMGALVTNVRLVDAHVTGNDQVGALVGRIRPGTVEKSYASVYVNGRFRVGGLVGDNHGGLVTNSHTSGHVDGFRNAGGLVGLSWNQGVVERSSSSASVFAVDYYAGGLLGQNRGVLHHSSATGDVNSPSRAGGLVGYNYKHTTNLGLITNCYATGNVNGTLRIGGLVGEHIGDVFNSYSTGKVLGDELVGGLIGDYGAGAGNTENSFWNVESSGMDTSNGGTGKNTVEMMDVATYTDLSTQGLDEPWDFVGDPNDDTGPEDIWNIDENFNRGYPFMNWRTTLIYDWFDLDNIRNDLGGNYVLVNHLTSGTLGYGDLVGTAEGWAPIGNEANPFTGTFDGNGYTISDLYINRPTVESVGLFGYAFGSEIKDVQMIDVDITGRRRVGGLVGCNDGLIMHSSASGSVEGVDGWYNGVLVGRNRHDGQIIASYSSGVVEGPSGLGGICGVSHGIILNSYSTADVIGTGNNIGGLVGEQRGAVINCYSTGEVMAEGETVGGLIGRFASGTVENSFWDRDSSDQEESAGGTGKTTAQMKNIATFTDTSTEGLDEPWDFFGDPNDDVGEDDIWDIHENIKDGYPFLTWEPMAIYDWYDLHEVRNDLSGDYTLMNDIDENSAGYHELVNTSLGFKPIGDNLVPFTGTFDGNGNEIGDLYINRSDENNVGLFGRIYDATIVDLMVSGTVAGRQWVGGVVGYSQAGNTLISNTVSNVDVTNVDTSAFDRAGGLVGILHNGNRINNSSAHGTITGPNGAILGGLVGSIFQGNVIIETSYATGLVNNGNAGTNVGGLVGFKHADAQVIDSYWDIQTSQQDVSAGGMPLGTNEMTGGRATAAGAMEGFDFYDTWYITESYPQLALHYDINDHLEGQGTEADPYRIETVVGLQSMDYALQENFVLGNDIDASETNIWHNGSGFRPVGRFGASFSGSLDGNGHEIVDLYINRPGENNVGLFGRVRQVTIENLRVSGSITGDWWVGGVVGYSDNNLFINRTVTNVAVTGNNRLGGLIGVMHNGDRIHDCAAHGPVNGPSTSNIGGLVGRIHTSNVIIETSYSTGLVNNGDPGDDVGGLVGFKHDDAQVIDSYWDMLTTEQNVSAGGTPLETNEMTGGRATAAGAMEGFDFYDTWYITESYPELAVHYDINDHLEGQGTQADPYKIETVVGLQSMNYALQGNFVLENNIDASETGTWFNGTGFNPVGYVAPFQGRFDGQDHEISDLYINRPDTFFVGLFKHMWENAEVSNVGLVDVDIRGDWLVGGLMGLNFGTVENTYVTGSVTGSGQVGGLIGVNAANISDSYSTAEVIGSRQIGGLVGRSVEGATVSNSYATGNVSGDWSVGGLIGKVIGWDDLSVVENSYSWGDVIGSEYVGGFVGFNVNGTITNSYSSGMVTRLSGSTNETVGGFVGENDQGIITKCYSVGSVHYEDAVDPTDKGFAGVVDTDGYYEMSNNFWDMETSGQYSTAGNATGKTTWEMQDAETFLNTDTEGLDEPWDIEIIAAPDLENDYPRLSWQDGHPVWYIEQTSYAVGFHVNVDDITAGEHPVIELFNAEDQAGNPLEGVINVTMEIDGVLENVTLSFTDGEANHTWQQITEAGDYTVVVTMNGLTNSDTFTVVTGDVDYIEISPQTSSIHEGQSETYTSFAFDEFGNEIGDVTGETTWSIEAGAGGSWSDNVYTSENPGTWTVTGTYDGVTDEAALTVLEDTGFVPENLVLNVSPLSGEAPLEVTIFVSAENAGEEDGSIGVVIDGTVFYTLVVPAEGSAEHTFTHLFDLPGTYVIEFHDLTETVVVEDVSQFLPENLILSVGPTSGEAPLEVTIYVSADNAGQLEGEIDVIVDGTVEYTLTVPAEGSADHTFTYIFQDLGTYQIEFHGLTQTVIVYDPTGFAPIDLELDVDPISGEPPLTVTITVSAENVGAETGSIDVIVDGTVAYSLEIPAGDTADHSFTHTFNTVGEYDIVFGHITRTVTVEEAVDTYTLTVNVEGEGTVDIVPDQVEYDEGTEVTLTATPSSGWIFSHWTGDHPVGQSEERTITVTMDGNKGITAHFEEVTDLIDSSVEITSPEDGTTIETDSVMVQWTSQEGTYQIIRHEVRLNTGTWIDVGVALQHTFEDLEDGEYTVTVRVVDLHGNEDTDSVTFTVDTDDTHIPPDDDDSTLMDLLSDYWWILLLLVIVVIIVVVLVAKRGKKGPVEEQYEEPYQEQYEEQPYQEPYEEPYQEAYPEDMEPPVEETGDQDLPPPPEEF